MVATETPTAAETGETETDAGEANATIETPLVA